MNFPAWQQLSPEEAAREVHHRATTRLTGPQQKAVLAWLPSEARLVAEFSAADRTGLLGGVPYLLKDLFAVAGQPTFAGSAFLPQVRPTPTNDSTIVCLLRSKGAVLAGKTQLHEFAYGITGENPHYGDCEHPGFPGRTSGGSSSGSAAAVAARIVPFAIGTDTGGSIRVPAAFCGLFGFRHQPGTDLIGDAFPLAATFDTVGWFTGNAADMAVATTALIGATASGRSPRGCYLELPGLDSDVAAACSAVSATFAPPADAATFSALLQAFEHCSTAYNQIVAAEAWKTHSPWVERFRAQYDPGVWHRLQRGAAQLPAEYNAALTHLGVVRLAWAEFFQHYDFLVLPATPFGALTKAECSLANRTRMLALTAPASLAGLPVLTLPVPLASGLTCGLQVVVRDPQSAAIPWLLSQYAAASTTRVVP